MVAYTRKCKLGTEIRGSALRLCVIAGIVVCLPRDLRDRSGSRSLRRAACATRPHAIAHIAVRAFGRCTATDTSRAVLASLTPLAAGLLAAVLVGVALAIVIPVGDAHSDRRIGRRGAV